MGDPKGFMKYAREGPKRKPVELRVLDWKEMYEPIFEDKLRAQGARCMDCGVPFCQGNTGCPVVNLIPGWNDLVYRGRWNDAGDASRSAVMDRKLAVLMPLLVGGLAGWSIRAGRKNVTEVRIETVILPQRNENDLDDVPDEIRRSMRFIFVETVDQVLDQALASRPADREARAVSA